MSWVQRFYRPVKFWWQRRTWGFDERDLWSLDHAIITFIYPRLRLFREDNYGGFPFHPTELDGEGNPRTLTAEEWGGILDEMLAGFKLALDANSYPLSGEDQQQLERSLDVLRKWFFALWN